MVDKRRKKPSPEPSPAFLLQGVPEPLGSDSALRAQAVRVAVKAEFRPGLARAGVPPKTFEVSADDVLEIELEDGQRMWLRADDYRARFGAPASRDAAGQEILAVPDDLALLPRGMQARGPISWAVKSLKVLGVDLAGATALLIARLVEERPSEKRPGLGLYRCAMATGGFALQPAALDKADIKRPYLVFIHGTASSTWGSFGELWSKEREAELTALRETYGDRVLAFEHRSLSESPIENALALAEALPPKARLHLVSHSRGGLVGELLCRAGVTAPGKKTARAAEGSEPTPFQAEELRLFEGDERYAESREGLRKLDAKLKARRFDVERFARVGCPALGTTLASGRLDRWFSVIGSLAGRALPASPVADTFKNIADFVAAVVQERTDPKTLPGLEAMMPESAFIRLVNWPKTTVPGDLTVIAGDIDPDAWWAKLLVWATDRFYDGDHDLVVNTPSMYGGAARSGAALVSFHKGPTVNHFTYFRNRESAVQLVRALTRKADDLSGFEPLERPTVDIAREVTVRSAEPRPVVFVLPGIMGSELEVGRDRVWLDIPALLFGGLARLRMEARHVRPVGVLARYYGDLVKFLGSTHRVVPFPFDWRLPVEEEADRLAQAVEAELEQAKRDRQPVRIVAHSMGGLVARTMIARHGALWREVCAHAGARLVMLGTPNGGSHAITELLIGQSSTFRKLALIDSTHDTEELHEVVSRFPGVLAMLPRDAREDYFSPQTWADYHAKAGKGWVQPREADLARAREFRQLLDGSPVDPQRTVYVAGCADVTVAGMRWVEGEGEGAGRIEFLATVRGDGKVTWDTGIPQDVPTWYLDVEHGDLPACEEAFPAFLELLQAGSTALLPQTPPVSRAAAAPFPMPPPADELYPDADGLAAAALGAGARKHRRAARRERPVRLTVAHGNLAFGRYPVAAGHYAGDTIISAERQLDRALGRELSRRHQLGLYPGAIETSAVFVNPDRDGTPKGAIVVGLGTVGSLSESSLSRTFTRALLDYTLEWCEGNQGIVGEGEIRELGVTSLLIGTGAGGIGVAESVFALLRGLVRANEALAAANQSVRVGSLEFLELWEDRAIKAVRALDALRVDPQLRGRLAFDGSLETRKGGLRRVTYDEPGGWWERLQVLGDGERGDTKAGTLRFVAMTRRARNEVRLLPTQRALVDGFIEQSIRTTRDNRTVARTLYEQLLPNELKEQAPEQGDMVLLLDEEAARYPWELLEDRWSRDGKPFVIEHGLIRQLETREFRETVRQVTANAALVIGDPLSAFVELKGAQAEAEAVARSLQANGRFQVELRTRPTSDQVINALYARVYRVLHLAGHGVYRYRPPEASRCGTCGQAVAEGSPAAGRGSVEPMTGMVIGDGVVLSPVEVHQMRHVPDLVFVNCCHLGHIEPGEGQEARQKNERTDYNRIAANLATEFIRMGVRAVVAAGWAVDDAAASTFAGAFYDAMLAGAPFGEAVKRARGETFDRHPQTNTWGAYQCYGDPDYRLVRDTAGDESEPSAPSFVAPAEALAEVENLAARLANMAGQTLERERRRLEAIVKVLGDKGWLGDGRMCTALAGACGAAELLDDAVHWYRAALAADPQRVTLRDLEQLADLTSRAAVQAWRSGNETGRARRGKGGAEAGVRPRDPLGEVDDAIRQLEWLINPPAAIAGEGGAVQPGRTVERLALLGSAYNSRGWISPEPAESLARMRDWYREAYRLSVETKGPDPYPLMNVLSAEVALGWIEPGRADARPPAELERELAAVRGLLARGAGGSPEFWTAAMLADCDLLEGLLKGNLDGRLDALAARYLEARKLAYPREFASVVDQIDFLAAMAAGRTPAAEALVRLGRKLREVSA